MDELLGLATLLVIAVIATPVILSAVIARDAVRPPRHTAGYALARGLATDPGDLGLPFEAWTLDLPHGVLLPVWEIKGPGTVTAVLLHDWGQSRIDSLARIKPWDELCRRVVLYDLRGHGEADGGDSRVGWGEHRDLLALLQRLGGGPIVLVGCGLGGVIARAAASEAQDADIVGVAVDGSFPGLGEWLRARLRHAGIPTGLLAPLALVWMRLLGIRDPGSAQEDAGALQALIDRFAAQGTAPSASSSGPR